MQVDTAMQAFTSIDEQSVFRWRNAVYTLQSVSPSRELSYLVDMHC